MLIHQKLNITYPQKVKTIKEVLNYCLGLGFQMYSELIQPNNEEELQKSHKYKAVASGYFEKANQQSMENHMQNKLKEVFINKDDAKEIQNANAQYKIARYNAFKNKDILFTMKKQQNQNFYKYSVIQHEEHKCIEIILTCSQLFYLDNLFIENEVIMPMIQKLYQKEIDDDVIKSFLKKLCKKIYIQNNKVLIEGVQFYQNLDELIQIQMQKIAKQQKLIQVHHQELQKLYGHHKKQLSEVTDNDDEYGDQFD